MADDNVFDLNKFRKEQQQQHGAQSQQAPRLTRQDVMDAPDVQCSNCGKELFLPATRLKRISKLLTGAAEDQMVPMQTLVCANCGIELGNEFDKTNDTGE